MECPLILRLVIRCNSEILMASLDSPSVLVRDKDPDSRRTRIVARSTIGVDYEFHGKYFVNK